MPSLGKMKTHEHSNRGTAAVGVDPLLPWFYWGHSALSAGPRAVLAGYGAGQCVWYYPSSWTKICDTISPGSQSCTHTEVASPPVAVVGCQYPEKKACLLSATNTMLRAPILAMLTAAILPRGDDVHVSELYCGIVPKKLQLASGMGRRRVRLGRVRQRLIIITGAYLRNRKAPSGAVRLRRFAVMMDAVKTTA